MRARHPLIGTREKVLTLLDGRREFTTLVITGPNTGGKTVTLKTGLLALMAQSACRSLPPTAASCPCSTRCSPSIGDEQSIEQSLSHLFLA